MCLLSKYTVHYAWFCQVYIATGQWKPIMQIATCLFVLWLHTCGHTLCKVTQWLFKLHWCNQKLKHHNLGSRAQVITDVRPFKDKIHSFEICLLRACLSRTAERFLMFCPVWLLQTVDSYIRIYAQAQILGTKPLFKTNECRLYSPVSLYGPYPFWRTNSRKLIVSPWRELQLRLCLAIDSNCWRYVAV